MRFARVKQTGLDGAWARLERGRGEERGEAQRLSAAPWAEGCAPVGELSSWSEAELLAPVRPSKIVCVGRNYLAHARELGNDAPAEPLLFLKPPSAVVGPGGVVLVPAASERVEHEAELGVVIGRRAKNVAKEQALAHVFGYTCVCDVTARDLQRKDGQWTRAKGFDTFCPVGPWIETELDPSDVRVACTVDGVTRQEGRTAAMIFDVPTLVSYVSRVMTLEPGDLLATGTPEGVGPLTPGSRAEVEVGGVGVLRFTVERA